MREGRAVAERMRGCGGEENWGVVGEGWVVVERLRFSSILGGEGVYGLGFGGWVEVIGDVGGRGVGGEVCRRLRWLEKDGSKLGSW